MNCIKVSVVFMIVVVFFFNDTATTEIYTLSLHDALPISGRMTRSMPLRSMSKVRSHFSSVSWPSGTLCAMPALATMRSEEHTSELQSQSNLVCRLLLEKKNTAIPLSIRQQTQATHTLSP